MAPKPVIRAVKLGDIENVVRLCAEHAAYEKAQFSPKGKADRLRRALFAGVPRLWCFVAEAGGSIVGYATRGLGFESPRELPQSPHRIRLEEINMPE
jgi:hypothetical protein